MENNWKFEFVISWVISELILILEKWIFRSYFLIWFYLDDTVLDRNSSLRPLKKNKKFTFGAIKKWWSLLFIRWSYSKPCNGLIDELWILSFSWVFKKIFSIGIKAYRILFFLHLILWHYIFEFYRCYYLNWLVLLCLL